MIHKKLISRLSFCGKDVFFLIFILFLGLLAVWSYLNLDQKILSLLCEKPIFWHKYFWPRAFTYLGKAWVMVWLLLIWFLSTGRKQSVLIGFLALIIVSLTVNPLKVTVGRLRPCEVIRIQSGQQEQSDFASRLSFPSGDASVAFAIAAVMISFVTWPLGCLLLAASTGIALLRVTAMDHYPSDVFAGAAIGTFAGWLAIQIDQRWLPLERSRFNLSRGIAILGIAIIPLAFTLSRGIDNLVIFFETYGLLAIFILLAAKASEFFKKIHAITELANSRFFVYILIHLRKRRALALLIVFPIMIALNIFERKKPHELGLHDISIMAIIGLILVLFGASIRVWARGHFKKDQLFTTGPYALVRHPLYLGSFFVVFGILLQLNYWLNWIIILPIFAIFHGASIICEEKSLEQRFGKQWQLYKTLTPAIIPSLRNCEFLKRISKQSWNVYLGMPEVKITPVIVSVPLLIELIEDLVFEGLLGV